MSSIKKIFFSIFKQCLIITLITGLLTMPISGQIVTDAPPPNQKDSKIFQPVEDDSNIPQVIYQGLQERDYTLLVISFFVFFSSYLFAIVGDLIDFNLDFPEFFAPVVGQWVGFFRADTFTRDKYIPNQKNEKYLILIGAVLQTAAAINSGVLIYQRDKADTLLNNSPKNQEKDQSKLSIEPLGLFGLKLVYQE